MKIAVTATGHDLESSTDPRFGRAQGFIIYDSETEEFSYVDNNQNYQSVQGAGIQSAKHVIDAGAEILITGNIGPKAYTALNSANVTILLCRESTVKDSIESWKKGELEETSQANVSGHWGGM